MKRFASIIETVPEPCRIFGTVLRPFCLGHHLMFTRLGFPYADNPLAAAKADQFMQAIFVCAHSYEENLEGQLDGTWAASCEAWMRRVQDTKPDYLDAGKLFQSHLIAGYQIAPVWRHVNKSQVSLSAPWEQLVKCRLIAAGFALSDILNGYLPGVWYDYFTAMELRQAETTSEKDWKPVFYTFQDAMAEAEIDAREKGIEP